MSRTYSWDDRYCPKGHGDWVFIPPSTLHSDIYWCEKCDLFYCPKVAPLTKAKLNEEYTSDRAAALIEYAEFLQWRANLTPQDMTQLPPSQKPGRKL